MCDFSWISEISWNISLTSSSSIKAGLHQLEVRTGDLHASFVQIQHRGRIRRNSTERQPSITRAQPVFGVRHHPTPHGFRLGSGLGNRKSDLPALLSVWNIHRIGSWIVLEVARTSLHDPSLYKFQASSKTSESVLFLRLPFRCVSQKQAVLPVSSRTGGGLDFRLNSTRAVDSEIRRAE